MSMGVIPVTRAGNGGEPDDEDSPRRYGAERLHKSLEMSHSHIPAAAFAPQWELEPHYQKDMAKREREEQGYHHQQQSRPPPPQQPLPPPNHDYHSRSSSTDFLAYPTAHPH